MVAPSSLSPDSTIIWYNVGTSRMKKTKEPVRKFLERERVQNTKNSHTNPSTDNCFSFG